MATESPLIRIDGLDIDGLDHADAPVEVEDISELGMVFRSRHFLSQGTKLAIGLHLCPPVSGCDALPCEGGGFLTLEALVVECHMVSDKRGGHSYGVTLLFDGVGESEREMLRGARPSVGGAGDREMPGAFYGAN